MRYQFAGICSRNPANYAPSGPTRDPHALKHPTRMSQTVCVIAFAGHPRNPAIRPQANQQMPLPLVAIPTLHNGGGPSRRPGRSQSAPSPAQITHWTWIWTDWPHKPRVSSTHTMTHHPPPHGCNIPSPSEAGSSAASRASHCIGRVPNANGGGIVSAKAKISVIWRFLRSPYRRPSPKPVTKSGQRHQRGLDLPILIQRDQAKSGIHPAVYGIFPLGIRDGK
jgi:hypothetical protein